jgi:hypothetical protein
VSSGRVGKGSQGSRSTSLFHFSFSFSYTAYTAPAHFDISDSSVHRKKLPPHTLGKVVRTRTDIRILQGLHSSRGRVSQEARNSLSTAGTPVL